MTWRIKPLSTGIGSMNRCVGRSVYRCLSATGTDGIDGESSGIGAAYRTASQGVGAELIVEMRSEM